MIELPRALAAWESELALFPREIALVLGAVAARLSSLIGDPVAPSGPSGEPDGLGGLARRGTYDRLLPTEWLLLDELPEEFLRRVVSSEHVFLERAYRQEPTHKRSLVLFDGGPYQLGPPRVVHPAALVVLAQRARAQHASVAWATLQDQQGTVHEGITEASIMGLLRGRSARTPNAADVERFGPAVERGAWSEIWFVGAPSLEPHAVRRRASLLAVSEVLEPGDRSRLHVRAQRATASTRERPREAVVELPPQATAVRILRDPFRAAVAPRVRPGQGIDPTSTILFALDGRRVFVRGLYGGLIALFVPNSPRASAAPTQVFALPEGERILAVGEIWEGKRTRVLTQGATSLFLHVLSKRRSSATTTARFEVPEGYAPPTPARLAPLGGRDAERACFIDGNESLVELKGGRLSVIEDAGAVASKATRSSIATGGGLTYVRSRPHPPFLVAATWDAVNDLERRSTSIPLDSPREPASTWAVHWRGDTLIYCRSSRSWTVRRPGTVEHHMAPTGADVVGFVERASDLHLVVVDANRTRISLYRLGHSERGSEQTTTIVTTTSKITDATVSDSNGDVAYLTEAGELGVYSCNASAIVVRATSESLRLESLR